MKGGGIVAVSAVLAAAVFAVPASADPKTSAQCDPPPGRGVAFADWHCRVASTDGVPLLTQVTTAFLKLGPPGERSCRLENTAAFAESGIDPQSATQRLCAAAQAPPVS